MVFFGWSSGEGWTNRKPIFRVSITSRLELQEAGRGNVDDQNLATISRRIVRYINRKSAVFANIKWGRDVLKYPRMGALSPIPESPECLDNGLCSPAAQVGDGSADLSSSESLEEFHVLAQDFFFQVVCEIELSNGLKAMIRATIDGMQEGFCPIPVREGKSGTYLMRGPLDGKPVSVFKPSDEEPGSPSNSKGSAGGRKGTFAGEGDVREVAAYLLDHPLKGEEGGFSGVPPTIRVKCSHAKFNYRKGFSIENPKIGSLQLYKENDGSLEDIGHNIHILEGLQRISVLDIRLANAGRHLGNILWRREQADGRVTLIPIDHAYCLPHSFESCLFDWRRWEATNKPFSDNIIEYVNSLDAEKDLQILKANGIDMPLDCIRVLRISTKLLKKAVDKGLSPRQIGSIMCRSTLDSDLEESKIEEIIRKAVASIPPKSSEEELLQAVYAQIDLHLDQFNA
ncbi:hypothetical protein GIB67_006283 [Kingdonia uniflora]|nr:hypothetical protein GIB67_006283 [Kingdonia uniflora]